MSLEVGCERRSLVSPSDSLFFLHEKILAEAFVGAGCNVPPDGMRDGGSSTASIAQVAQAALGSSSGTQG